MLGICLYQPKKEINFGNIMRLAFNFNVNFVCTIGSRYKRLAADTTNSINNIPVFHYSTFSDFQKSRPPNNILISLEITNKSLNLENFSHPKNSIYIFGGEDRNLPDEIINQSVCLKIKTNRCLNLAQCAGMVLFHRHLQFFKN